MKTILNLARATALVVFSGILITSCVDSYTYNPSESVASSVSIPAPQEIISSTLYGRVLDEANEPIVDAVVKYHTGTQRQQLTTDDEGYFLLADVENRGSAAFLSVTSPGKFEAFRKFSLLQDQTNYTEIKMMNREIIGSVSSSTGGILTQKDGAVIDLPAKGIVDMNGVVYTGEVDVAMAWIDPSSEDLGERMVGDLSGIDEDGEIQSLSSMGMLQVELIGEDGTLLNLAEGEIATLTFPVPSSMMHIAEPVIPLWSYDEQAGFWIEEGEAYLEGNTYVGDVTHFSSWNVDYKSDPIEITGKVQWEIPSENGGASTYIGGGYLQMYVCSETIGRKGGWLTADGAFRFYNFPKDIKFTIKIFDECSNAIFEKEFGPYSEDQDLGVITAEGSTSSVIKITGNAVNCVGDPVTNGMVNLTQEGRGKRYPINSDGTFEIGYAHCKGFDINAQVFDLDGQLESDVVLIEGNATHVDMPNTEVCDYLDNYISIEFDEFEDVLFVENCKMKIRNNPSDDNTLQFVLEHNSQGDTSLLQDSSTFFSAMFILERDELSDPDFEYTDIPVLSMTSSGPTDMYSNFYCTSIIGDDVTVSFSEFSMQSETRVIGTIRGTALPCNEFGVEFLGSSDFTISFEMTVY